MNSARVWVILAVILTSACSALSPVANPRSYLMSAAPQAPLTTSSDLTIAVGPIVVADYLDQPLVVTRISDHELKLNADHRWASPLGRQIASAIRDNLEQLLPGARTSLYPSALAGSWDKRVAIEIHRLDGAINGDVELMATWQVLSGSAQTASPQGGEFHLKKSISATGINGVVAAESALIGELTASIGRALAP